jgi:hypothetical protein
MRALVLVSALFAIQSNHAIACTCERIDLETAIRSSPYVFRADINAVIVTNPKASTVRTRILFDNPILIKGENLPFSELYTIDSGSCGMEMLVPSSYWIFTGSEGLVQRCSFSQLASNQQVRPLEIRAYEDILQSLSRKTVETKGVEILDAKWTVALVSAFSAIFFIGGVFVGRHRKPAKIGVRRGTPTL